MYLLTWDKGMKNGVVGNDYVRMDIFDCPDIPFEFHYLQYEEAVGTFIRTDNKMVLHNLTEEEKAICHSVAEKLVEEANYPVQVWDDDGVYKGQAMINDVRNGPMHWALCEAPDHPASKRVGDTWERIVAVVRDDGSLVEMPEGICELCVLFFTEEEWKDFPHPKTPYETWDFVKEQWMDKRSLYEVKEEAKALVRRVLEGVREGWLGEIPGLERQTWQRQEQEARAWLKDSSTHTPFIDTALSKRTISKADFCADVVANADKTWRLLSRAHNLQWLYFDKIEACEDLKEVDKLVFDFGDVQFTMED